MTTPVPGLFTFFVALLIAMPAMGQQLSEEAIVLKNASDKDMADFYDCIENRAVHKYGQADDTSHIEYINEQAEALFEYFDLRDSLINDPENAAMMLKVAWKWGAREGGICNVEWTQALEEIRSNLADGMD